MSEDLPRRGADADAALAAEIRARVAVESARFRHALPSLLAVYRDKWVVFRDGVVASVHETDEEAYVAALDRFGPDGAFVIGSVRDAEVAILSGSVLLFGS